MGDIKPIACTIGHFDQNLVTARISGQKSTVLRKKCQSEIFTKGQTDFMHSNALGKKKPICRVKLHKLFNKGEKNNLKIIFF